MASINTDKINTDKLAERYPEAARELIDLSEALRVK